MKAETVTPLNLFDKPVRYVVPLFQRPYVWEKDKQWEPLWDDIRRTTEAFDALVAAGQKPEKAVTEAPRHFLGAIVVQAVTASAKYIPQRGVIDGQQRLTTLQILMDAAQAVVHDAGLDQAAAILDGLVANDTKYQSAPDDRFKVWPTNLDRDPYRAVMVAIPPVDHKKLDFPESRIVAAHRYFTEQVKSWAVEEGDPQKAARRLDSLATALRELLLVVEITLEEADNAQVIFETLNDRGTPLQASDLVKNLLFQEVEAAGAESEPLYDQYWKQFDTEAWRVKVSQGRLYRPRVDLFLQHWLILRTLADITATDIFSHFRTYARSAGAEPIVLLTDLSEIGQVWDAFEKVEPHSELGTFVYRQRVMQADSLGPVLLRLYDPGFGVPEEQRRLALSALESWLVRRMICRLTTKDYNSLYIELLKALDKMAPVETGLFIQDFLYGQTADSRLWPTDEQVSIAVASLPLYRLLTRGRLRMILEGIEDLWRGGKAEEPVVRGRLTIEHVMPQGWREHWPLSPGSLTEEDAEAQRDTRLHTLGNLTLLTQALNSSISNGPWTTKRKGIQDFGVLKLSAELKVADEWDDSAILKRSMELSKAIVEVWPRP